MDHELTKSGKSAKLCHDHGVIKFPGGAQTIEQFGVVIEKDWKLDIEAWKRQRKARGPKKDRGVDFRYLDFDAVCELSRMLS